MLVQFLSRRPRIARDQRTEISHLPHDEIANFREMGVNGNGSSRQKLIGEFP